MATALAIGDSDELDDVLATPRLPEEWQPLEYELLEYADKLPPGFVDRVATELEAQARAVDVLRAQAQKLLQREVGEREAASKLSAAAAVAATPAQEDPELAAQLPQEQFLATARQRAAAACAVAACAGTTAPQRRNSGAAAAAADAKRRAHLAENARHLESRTKQVRRAAERDVTALAGRIQAAEEQQKQLSKQAAEDALERKKLWEAEAELLRLRCRMQQLEAARRHAARRSQQREEEDKQLDADLAYLRAEVENHRAQQQEFDSMEESEDGLRRRLRAAKAQLQEVQLQDAQVRAHQRSTVGCGFGNRATSREASLQRPADADAAGGAVASPSLRPRRVSQLLVRHAAASTVVGSPFGAAKPKFQELTPARRSRPPPLIQARGGA